MHNSENDEDMFFFFLKIPIATFKKNECNRKLRVRSRFKEIILNELQSSEVRQPLLTTANMLNY